jgi:hypothetical protein
VVSSSSMQESISQNNCFLKSWSVGVTVCSNRSLFNSEPSQWTDMQRFPCNVTHMHSTLYWDTVQYAAKFCHTTLIPLHHTSENWCCLVWLQLIKLMLNTGVMT